VKERCHSSGSPWGLATRRRPHAIRETTKPFDPDEYELDDDDLPSDEDSEPESDDARDGVSEERIGFRVS
jgi:hypothetical protein